MNRSTLITLLVILALASLGYAIYRSTALRVTTLDANNQQIVYGDPQHGLLAGLCIFAGLCVLGIVYLVDRDRDIVRREERSDIGVRRTLS